MLGHTTQGCFEGNRGGLYRKEIGKDGNLLT
jgi:hypothetical protein